MICRCEPNSNDVMGETLENAAKSGPQKFYCYDYFFSYYCEMYPSERAQFEKYCMEYDPNIMGSTCRYLPTRNDEFIDPAHQTEINKEKKYNREKNIYEYVEKKN